MRLSSIVLALGVLGAIPAGAVPVEVRVHAVFPSGEPLTGLLGVFDTASPGPFDLDREVMFIDLTAQRFPAPEVVQYVPSSLGVPETLQEIGFEFTNATPGSLAGHLVDLNPADGEDDGIFFRAGGGASASSIVLTAVLLPPANPGDQPSDVLIYFGPGRCVFCGAQLSLSFTVVPEPATALLLSLGLAVVAWKRRARRGRERRCVRVA